MNSPNTPADRQPHREHSLERTLALVRTRRRQRQRRTVAAAAAAVLLLGLAAVPFLRRGAHHPPGPEIAHGPPPPTADPSQSGHSAATASLIQRVGASELRVIRRVGGPGEVPGIEGGQGQESDTLIQPADIAFLESALAAQSTGSILVGNPGGSMRLVRFE